MASATRPFLGEKIGLVEFSRVVFRVVVDVDRGEFSFSLLILSQFIDTGGVSWLRFCLFNLTGRCVVNIPISLSLINFFIQK